MDRAAFADDGFVVLRGAIDPAPLRAEIAAALAAGFRGPGARNVSAEAGIEFRYLPMMVASTPVSLGLLRRFTAVAEELLGRAVLPGRTKGVEYHGASGWHRDSELPVASVGFLTYLEPLAAATGALRVVPGSHQRNDAATAGAVAIDTAPGDVIILDEHLLHASEGGGVRLQWRVDFVARPTTAAEEEVVRRYYGGNFSPDWDGGYDVDAFPTYGPHWRAICDAEVGAELARLGAYAGAEAEESAVRRRRSAKIGP